jgi:hypothetical protein
VASVGLSECKRAFQGEATTNAPESENSKVQGEPCWRGEAGAVEEQEQQTLVSDSALVWSTPCCIWGMGVCSHLLTPEAPPLCQLLLRLESGQAEVCPLAEEEHTHLPPHVGFQ